jgi:ABC-type glycerol-3-phosphate transport system substrate-binding protein
MQTSNFQVIVLGVCTTLILVGIGVFASFGGFFGGKGIGKVVIWGTQDSEIMRSMLETLRAEDKSFENVSYIQKNPDTYNSELINAMAGGVAPDLFVLEDRDLHSFSDKILTIPYSSVSQSNFLSSFIDEGQIFLTKAGALALPFTIDPMVASPPKFWNEFLSLAPKITSRDINSNVRQSTIALGEWRNVAHAKEILATLFMQTGDFIVVRNAEGVPVVVLGTTPSSAVSNPAAEALRFYTEFANPSKTTYSWNRALPLSTNAFVSGDLAVYLGFASEYSSIASRNPNLRFSVATMPQIEGNATRITSGRITGLAIPLGSQNPSGALAIAQLLSGKVASAYLSKHLGLPSVRRDVSIATEDNAAASVFLQSALISRTWIDPSKPASDSIFQTMIESVVSGKSQPVGAVQDAAQELNRLFK